MAELDSVAKIKKLVFDPVFKRALDVASSNSLLNTSFEGDYLDTCTADCIGSSSSDVYKLNVTVIGASARGKCSCPAKAKDGLCKHIIALLLRRNDILLEKSASSSRARKQEDVVDEFPIECIGSPEEEPVASPPKSRTPMPDENESETVALKQSSSKRALPAWMLGVVGSTVNGESSKTSKPKRKARMEKPPLPPPPPTKRARRRGQPLKVTNDLDEEEGPGEVDVAEPVEEPFEEDVDEPVVEDGEKVDEPAAAEKRTGHFRKPMRPRSRYEMEIRKQYAGEIESNKGDENVGARQGKGQPQRRTKSRRVVGKLIEVESDLSENENSPSFRRNRGCVLEDVTDDDLMLLAQEQLAKENGRIPQGAQSKNRDVIPHEEKKVSEGQVPVKKTSRFSLNKWKEISSDKIDSGASLNLNADNLDLETLKTYSQSTNQNLEEPNTQGAGAGYEEFPIVQTTHAAEREIMTPYVPAHDETSAEKDSIANDMLDLIFGSSLSASVVPKSPIHRTEVSTNVGGDHSNGGDGFTAVKASSFWGVSPKSAAPVLPAAERKNTEDLSAEYKPKKKSSLKDKIKMLLD